MRRFTGDPSNPNKTVDLYEQEFEKTKDPLWIIAISLSRIADALEPDDNCENFFTQVERVSEKIELAAEEISEKIQKSNEDICRHLDAVESTLNMLDTTLDK